MKYQWLEPWNEIAEDQVDFFQTELLKEISSSHYLFGLQMRPIGRSLAADDILVLVNNSKYAVVHLTWAGKGDKAWPKVIYYDSWIEFVNGQMIPDNLAY